MSVYSRSLHSDRRRFEESRVDDPSRRDDPTLQRWGRRAVTIPLYIVLFSLALGVLPVALLVTAPIDAFRGSRWALSRCILFFAFYLGCEVAGIAVAAARIPKDRDAQIDWLYDHWSRVDEWVGLRSEEASTDAARSQIKTSLG